MDNIKRKVKLPPEYFVENLDKAIENKWIKAYHQPLIRAANGMVSDEEAFARWEDPEYGIFSAGDFIPALEEKGLTYKLDLYIIKRVLSKMKNQVQHNLFLVPESVNLARSDFDQCDMVTEIAKLIDASGISRDKLSIELSERVISSDIDFMRSQVERFKANGIKVWMDDYGSGYSSLLILLKVSFDLLKIDKVFIDQIEKDEAGRIILTELIKTALSLGMDTVAEGVETFKQAEFLKEVGCTKLQGYYFIRPISFAEILDRNKRGIQIGFENPAETGYFEQLGRINLYDLSISKDDTPVLSNYFNTMPMAIFSLDEEKIKLIRCNKSYREFVTNIFSVFNHAQEVYYNNITPGAGYYSFNAVRKCAQDGKRVIIDDRLKDGRTVQLFLRRVAVNPVTGACAVAIVILSISDVTEMDNLNYNYVARALSEDYINLYFVNLDNEEFTEYISDGESRDISLERHGDHFFDLDNNPDLVMDPKDKEQLKKDFTKEILEKEIKASGNYSVVSRIIMDNEPVYVSIKAVKVRGDGNYIIVGINNVDNQIKAREILDKAKEEELVYSRIGALSGDYIYIYTIDPETLHFKRYNPSGIISDLGINEEGDNFFDAITENVHYGIFREDVDSFLSSFNQENVMKQIATKGFFELHHRLNIKGKPMYVVTKATIVKEENEEKLLVGVLNVDERVKRELQYEENLFAAENKATIDELTGVKNKHAYTTAEKKLDGHIMQGSFPQFAIVIFDINNLKTINDTLGHQAGDQYIKNGCDTICTFFKHSPVFRIGGDEFAVIAQGYDLQHIDSIMSKFEKHILKNKLKGDVVIAAGMSRYFDDGSVAPVFKRADEEMYKNKKMLKAAGA